MDVHQNQRSSKSTLVKMATSQSAPGCKNRRSSKSTLVKRERADLVIALAHILALLGPFVYQTNQKPALINRLVRLTAPSTNPGSTTTHQTIEPAICYIGFAKVV